MHFIFEIVAFWKGKFLKRFFHRRNSGQVSNNLLGRLDDNILIKVFIFIHISQQGEKTVFIEHLDIVSLILIKDITEINFDETKQHTGVNLIDDI